MKLFLAVRARMRGLRVVEDGATAVEYGLMIALIALFILAAVALVGTSLSTLFTTLAADL